MFPFIFPRTERFLLYFLEGKGFSLSILPKAGCRCFLPKVVVTFSSSWVKSIPHLHLLGDLRYNPSSIWEVSIPHSILPRAESPHPLPSQGLGVPFSSAQQSDFSLFDHPKAGGLSCVLLNVGRPSSVFIKTGFLILCFLLSLGSPLLSSESWEFTPFILSGAWGFFFCLAENLSSKLFLVLRTEVLPHCPL